MGFKAQVNPDVPESACLPMPAEYRFPVHGDLAVDMTEALIGFLRGRHLYIYAMRTEDDRIALGGRGAPYHFNSKVSEEYEQVPRVHAVLERTLKQLFPAAKDARITHRWGGSVAIPRDWFPSVLFVTFRLASPLRSERSKLEM